MKKLILMLFIATVINAQPLTFKVAKSKRNFIYQSPSSLNESGLVFAYTGNKLSNGNVLVDVSGSGNSGTVYGGVTYAGGTEGGLSFNGVSSYGTFPNSSSFAFGTGAFTIEFLLKAPLNDNKFLLSGRNGNGAIITCGGYGGSTSGCLRYIGSSTITSGSTLITNNQWNTCAIVRDASYNITLYINGINVGTGTDNTFERNGGC